jgi:predicted anti-sigma-YlaC factor YlaD
VTAAKQRNRAAVLGPLVAIAGFASYFTVFYRWPALRDVPWLNYALLALAVGLSAVGLRRAWPRGGALRRAGAAAGLLVSGAIALFFAWYTLSGSRQLPDAANALAIGAPLPRIALLDQTGQRVELAALDQPLVLVFYRGFW